MTFEERKRAAERLVAIFLNDFSVPRGMSLDQQSKRITQIADAFARRMPTKGDYDEACGRVLERIRDTHMSNSWPPQAVFVMAMPQTETVQPKAAETFAPDPDEIAMKRINAGEAVSEGYVWGSGSQRLLNRGWVTRDAIDRYREGSIRSHKETYGHKADDVLRRNFGAVVNQYIGAPHAAE